jgi:hypothetical protein
MEIAEGNQPLSENEAALYAALTAIVQTLPVGPGRARLAALLDECRGDFLLEGKPQAAALLGLLGSYAKTGHS